MVQWDEVRVPLRAEALLQAAQRGEILEPKRQLENRSTPTATTYGSLEDRPFGPSGREHQLMMFGGIGREENHLFRPTGNSAAVRHGHTEDSRVEIPQAGEVETAQPDSG